MRVGFYHCDLPTPGRKPGGVSVAVHRLACELADRGVDLTVWSMSAAPSNANYRHVRMWPRLAHRGYLTRVGLVPTLLNALPLEGLDVLHLHGDDWFLLRRNVPTVRTLYGSGFLEARSGTRLRRQAGQAVVGTLELLAARLATATYGLGPGVPDFIPVEGTLDIGISTPGPTTVRRRSEEPSILFVGSWHGRKRGEFLHDTFLQQVLPNCPSAQLWMVCDRHSDDTPNVRWFRSPNEAELAGLYDAAWAFALPSTYEGFGIPYLEAMARGAAVVATPNVGSSYLIGQTGAGWIVPDGQLGNALVNVLTSAALRDALVKAGYERAAEFNWDRVVAQHLAAYERAVHAFNLRRS